MGKKKIVAVVDSGSEVGADEFMGGKAKRVPGGVKGTGISGMWAVPVVYGVIAGVEGLLAGSVVGLV